MNSPGHDRPPLRTAADDAEALEAARLETLGRLAQRVAHDCNNLLMVVLGHADLLVATAEERSPSAWPTVQEDADQICRATRQAGDLMRQLLDFARATGDLDGEFRADRLLKDLGTLLRIAVPKSTTLLLEGPFPPLTIAGSAGEIRQLVTQLVLNAAAVMPDEGGRVVVRLRDEQLSAETAAEWEPALGVGRVAILEVQDNGQPRPTGVRGRLLGEPAPAIGDGLATVERIVRRHGGAFRVEEAPGLGTRCRVALPLRR